jgi:hypothetical protein
MQPLTYRIAGTDETVTVDPRRDVTPNTLYWATRKTSPDNRLANQLGRRFTVDLPGAEPVSLDCPGTGGRTTRRGDGKAACPVCRHPVRVRAGRGRVPAHLPWEG